MVRLKKASYEEEEDSYLISFLVNMQRLLEQGKDIPEEEIEFATERPEYSYELAKTLLGFHKDVKDIPEDLIDGISENAWYSYKFATDLLKSGKDIKDIPLEIMMIGIAKDPKISHNFILEVIKHGKDIKDVPRLVIKSVATNPEYSFRISQYLNFDKEKIPQKIQESAKEYEYYEDEFEKQGGLFVKSKWLKMAQLTMQDVVDSITEAFAAHNLDPNEWKDVIQQTVNHWASYFDNVKSKILSDPERTEDEKERLIEDAADGISENTASDIVKAVRNVIGAYHSTLYDYIYRIMTMYLKGV